MLYGGVIIVTGTPDEAPASDHRAPARVRRDLRAVEAPARGATPRGAKRGASVTVGGLGAVSRSCSASGFRSSSKRDRPLGAGTRSTALFRDAAGLFEKSRRADRRPLVGQIDKRELDARPHARKVTRPHLARDHALRERGGDQEVARRCSASTTWRSIRGRRSPRSRAEKAMARPQGRRPDPERRRGRPTIGRSYVRGRQHAADPARHPRGRRRLTVGHDHEHRPERQAR